MAVGRRPQPQERAFGGEVVGVANAALAVFLILAFHSYRAGDAQANQMGLVGYLLADLLCPALGRACYLLPGALLYGAAVLFHLLRCSAPFAQAVSFVVFSLSVAAFLARRIGFLDIARIVEDVLATAGLVSEPAASLQQVHAAEHEARRRAEDAVKSHELTN